MVEARLEIVIHHAYFRLGLYDHMKDVWRSDYECQCDVGAEVKRSAGWLEYLADLAAATASPPLPSQNETLDGPTTAGRVEDYIAKVRLRTDRKDFCRADIWKELGYQDATEFQRWQRDDPRTTPTARSRFERILDTKPHLKGTSKP